MGKNKALAHHTSAYFHTRRVSISDTRPRYARQRHLTASSTQAWPVAPPSSAPNQRQSDLECLMTTTRYLTIDLSVFTIHAVCENRSVFSSSRLTSKSRVLLQLSKVARSRSWLLPPHGLQKKIEKHKRKATCRTLLLYRARTRTNAGYLRLVDTSIYADRSIFV